MIEWLLMGRGRWRVVMGGLARCSRYGVEYGGDELHMYLQVQARKLLRHPRRHPIIGLANPDVSRFLPHKKGTQVPGARVLGTLTLPPEPLRPRITSGHSRQVNQSP